MAKKDSNQNHSVGLSRDLGLLDITMIGVGAMIGAGIFVLTGLAAGTAGPALILAFAINGVIAVFTAMVYAELGSAIPEAGGGYLWVKEGLPGPNAFLAGWMSWFAHAVAGSLYALGFGSYLFSVLQDFHLSVFGLHGELAQKALAVIIILIFVAINFKGVSETGMAGNIVTISKVIILIIFIGSGLWALIQHPHFMNHFLPFQPKGFGGIVSAMGLTFIAFEGYEIIVQAGEEVKNPRQTIPKAVILSMAIVLPIYILIAFTAIGAVNTGSSLPTYIWLGNHQELGIVEAAKQFMPLGSFLLTLGGLLATMSALNATTFSSTRVAFAMGRDKNLPDIFSQISEKTRTPYKALLFSGALILFMAVVIPLEDVASAADIMFLFLFLQVNIAVITIRKKYGERLKYGFLVPFFPVVPIVGVIANLGIALYMFHFSPTAWYFTIAWIAVGSVIYYLYARPREESEERTPVVLEERLPEAKSERYEVLVPVANPDSLSNLLPPAIEAAKRYDGVVILLNVISVPDQLNLSAGRRYVDRSREVLQKARQIVEDAGAEAEVLIRIAHRLPDAIIQTALERDVDLMVMGWRGKSSNVRVTVGNKADYIMDEVNCDVLVVQQMQNPPFKKVVVPIANPNTVEELLRKAVLINENSKDAQIDLLHIFKDDMPDAEKEVHRSQLKELVQEYLDENPDVAERVHFVFEDASDIIGTIVEKSKEYDAIVLGATNANWTQRRFLVDKPVTIGRQIQKPVMLVRSRSSQVEFGMQRFMNYMQGGYKRIKPSSEKKLEKEGILAPKGEQQTADLHTRVNKIPLLLCGILAIGSCVLMILGAGHLLTWIGMVAFFVGLGWFTQISIKGTIKQQRRKPQMQEQD